MWAEGMSRGTLPMEVLQRRDPISGMRRPGGCRERWGVQGRRLASIVSPAVSRLPSPRPRPRPPPPRRPTKHPGQPGPLFAKAGPARDDPELEPWARGRTRRRPLTSTRVIETLPSEFLLCWESTSPRSPALDSAFSPPPPFAPHACSPPRLGAARLQLLRPNTHPNRALATPSRCGTLQPPRRPLVLRPPYAQPLLSPVDSACGTSHSCIPYTATRPSIHALQILSSAAYRHTASFPRIEFEPQCWHSQLTISAAFPFHPSVQEPAAPYAQCPVPWPHPPARIARVPPRRECTRAFRRLHASAPLPMQRPSAHATCVLSRSAGVVNLTRFSLEC